MLLVAGAVLSCGATWAERRRNLAALAFAGGGLVLILLGINALITEPETQSLWMPRYMGVLWPAAVAVVAVLLLRLPTWPLRWGAIALLVALNLTQFAWRLTASEPPIDVIVADLVAAKSDPTTRVFFENLAENDVSRGDPGRGWIGTLPHQFYLAHQDPDLIAVNGNPEDLANFDVTNTRRGRPLFRRDGLMPTRLRQRRGRRQLQRLGDDVNQLILWQARNPDAEVFDYAQVLGDDWQRTDQQHWRVHDHWRWVIWSDTTREVWQRNK